MQLTYLDLVHIADGVVEFDRSTPIKATLTARSTVQGSGSSLRSWCLRSATRLARSRASRHLRTRSLMRSIEAASLSCSLDEETRTILRWRAECCFGTLYTMLRALLRPLSCSLGKQTLPWHWCSVAVNDTTACDRLNGCTHRCRDTNRVGVAIMPTLDPVTGRQERVEALNEIWVPSEQFRHTIDDARCIDTAEVS